MQLLFLKHRKNINYILILLLIIAINGSMYAQKTQLIKPIKKDSLLKEEVITKKERPTFYNGHDGPFIINDSLLYRISKNNKLVVEKNFKRDSIKVIVSNEDEDAFFVSLSKDYNSPKTKYDLPKKMIVVSDIEGNFNAFYSFLFSNKVIDEDFNWIYGKGHLVLNGDFVDRGQYVTQVLWLIYKLEQQAKAQEGMVHLILGNHEIMNFNGDYRYNRSKTIKAAKAISQLKTKSRAVKFLYSRKSEIGKWLSTKNVIEQIGDYIFTHAGLSHEILKYDFKLKDINKLVRKKYHKQESIKNNKQQFLYSSKGPFWYRGLARGKLKLKKLNAILDVYDAKKIIVGHTLVDSISSKYGGKLINIDVHHGTQKFSGRTFGLRIENGEIYVVDDTYIRAPLEN